MDRQMFEEQFMTASSIVDSNKREKELLRSIDPDGIYIGSDGTRNLIIVMEELSELSQQISKFLRGKPDNLGLIEEIGDVYLALDYVKHICKISDEDINKAMNVKLTRFTNTKGIYC